MFLAPVFKKKSEQKLHVIEKVFLGSEVSNIKNSAILPKNNLLKSLSFDNLIILPLHLFKSSLKQVLCISSPYPHTIKISLVNPCALGKLQGYIDVKLEKEQLYHICCIEEHAM